MWTPPSPERLRVPEFLSWDVWPFVGEELPVRPLKPAVVPEPARVGEGGVDCPTCCGDDGFGPVVWSDADWRLLGRRETALAGACMLVSREHHDSFADLPEPLLRALGPLVARIERAILALGGVGRVHVLRYGDGGAHFHLHFLPRPLGALQLRGTVAQLWEDVLPLLDESAVQAALERIGQSLATAA